MGKLFVLEGIDGTGKSTQFELLCAALREKGLKFRQLSFPRYEQDSSALVRQYLAGAFGGSPDAVNPYAASSFYACDRYASYKQDWQADYEAGTLFVSCRYATANAIHQGAKLDGPARAEFLDWLFDYEYRRLGIPAPDRVIFLSLPAELALENIRRRNRDAGGRADIHEADADYLRRCAEAAGEAAARWGWHAVPCAQGGRMRPAADIHGELLRNLTNWIG